MWFEPPTFCIRQEYKNSSHPKDVVAWFKNREIISTNLAKDFSFAYHMTKASRNMLKENLIIEIRKILKMSESYH